jgi:hypothetical protein
LLLRCLPVLRFHPPAVRFRTGLVGLLLRLRGLCLRRIRSGYSAYCHTFLLDYLVFLLLNVSTGLGKTLEIN